MCNNYNRGACYYRGCDASTCARYVGVSTPHLCVPEEDPAIHDREAPSFKLNPRFFIRFQYMFLDSELVDYICSGVSNGFKIGRVDGNNPPPAPQNHASTADHVHMIREMVDLDETRGRKIGPFPEPPCGAWVSPLGVVPKSEPGKYRVIHDLSFPEGASVNDGIPDNISACTYGLLDEVLRQIWLHGKGSLMAKLDISEAYKHVPVHSSD